IDKPLDHVAIEQHATVAIAGMIPLQSDAHDRAGCRQRQIKQVEVEERITVQKQELRLQMPSRMFERAAGAKLRRLRHHRDRGVTQALAAVQALDLLGAMSGQQQDFLDGWVTRQLVQKVVEKWPSSDVQ